MNSRSDASKQVEEHQGISMSPTDEDDDDDVLLFLSSSTNHNSESLTTSKLMTQGKQVRSTAADDERTSLQDGDDMPLLGQYHHNHTEDDLNATVERLKQRLQPLGHVDFSAARRHLPPSTGKYEDFETIDWVKDVVRDRQRHRDIHSQRFTSLRGALFSYWDSASGWLCTLLVGLVVGLVAGVIDISTGWMSDLKEGVCMQQFWLNKEQCCWSLNITVSNAKCTQWYSWSHLLLGKEMAQPVKEGSSDLIYNYDAYFVCYLCFTLWGLLFAMLAVMLVRTFAPYACGSGIAEIKTILSGFIIRGFLGKWTLIIKSLGMILSVASGLSLGKEGPMVHLGTCCGNIVAYLFPKYSNNEAKKREILSASAGAGVAVAFGAPISGVLFALEEASYYFPPKTMFRAFFCAMCAASTLRFMNPFGNDHLVMYQVDYSNAQWHVFELLPFVFLGALGGIFGAVFIRANIWVCRARKTTRLGHWPSMEVFVLTVVTLLLSFPCVYLRMNTNELIKILVNMCGPGDTDMLCHYHINATDLALMKFGNFPAGNGVYKALGWLGYALVVKIVLTIFTSGTKVPAGLFIPSMAVGAIMGRMVGVGVEQWAVHYRSLWIFERVCESGMACINHGLYAMVGAAAGMGGVTRMTISLVVMMVELTGSMNCIIPLMVSTMMSKWVGDRLTRGSIYDEQILLNNYPFLNGHEDASQASTIAADAMCSSSTRERPHLEVVTQEGMNLAKIEDMLKRTKFSGYPVVQSRDLPYIVGFVTRKDLCWAIDEALASNPAVTSSSPVYFTEYLPVNVTQCDDACVACPLHLRSIVDLCPITVTDQTPMDSVVDFFRKLGLRQLLVSKNGRLLGIITKKDVLSHQLQH